MHKKIIDIPYLQFKKILYWSIRPVVWPDGVHFKKGNIEFERTKLKKIVFDDYFFFFFCIEVFSHKWY